jgi:4-amino-4-deoxy-L-arabinose transferase-like glycosyltransferase
MSPRFASPVLLLALWLALLLLSLLTRPLLPVDETRYLAVAWEMWQRGDFLVPYLNGAPYSDKPPLFFWLIQAGWTLFGVTEWWPRCLPGLISLAVLGMTTNLAKRLWPSDALARQLASWVLFGCIVWTAFYPWVQFDLLLVLCVVIAMTGLVEASRNRRRGWLLVGLAIGGGVLSKGPVVLLQVLPMVLLAPVWLPERPRSWWGWYAGLGASVLLGAAIALAWALPAAQAGGADYREAIFWGQTANRLVNALDHAHPWWWYLPWLPLLCAPWLLLPWLWGPVLRALRDPHDAGVRFCMIWLLSTLLVMSVPSGKQLKYLLPLLPAFALLVARVLSQAEQDGMARRPRVLAGMLALCGLLLAVAPVLVSTPPWLASVNPFWGGMLIAGSAVLFTIKPLRAAQYPTVVALLSSAVLGVVYLGVFRVAAPAYDLRAASRVIAAAEAAGRPVASLSAYHGQFGFYGRLTRPIEILDRGQALDWAAAHPEGYLIAYYPGREPADSAAVHEQSYRGGHLVIWEGRTLAADPALLP